MNTFWAKDIKTLSSDLHTDLDKGLSTKEANDRIEKYGLNSLTDKNSNTPLKIFLSQFKSPISLILIFATIISIFLKDYVDATIIFIIIFISGLLGFWQEYNAGTAVSKLLDIVRIKANVCRDGNYEEIYLEEIVPGDIISLTTGDVIPADGVVIASNNLSIDESTLTGETFPEEKRVGPIDENTPLAKRTNSLWMGTHVSSGSGKMLVVQTGKDTEFGKISQSFRKKEPQNEFEKGIYVFGMMLIQITTFIMLLIFGLNIVLKKPVFDSFMFSLALAVGLTPQLLPAIISINLSHGAKEMSKKKVIVKKLNSIENFGSMDILCTDKTGTITQGKVKVHGVFDAFHQPSAENFKLAVINATLQSGFTNPIDIAIKEKAEEEKISLTEAEFKKMGEEPYSFESKRLSVACEAKKETIYGEHSFIVGKGALKNILNVCTKIRKETGEIVPISPFKDSIQKQYQTFSNEGYRTLGLCYKPFKDSNEIEFGKDMIFAGFITLYDPLKEDVQETIERLNKLGVTLKIITGDNELVAKHIASQLNLDPEQVLTGGEINAMNFDSLANRVQSTCVFAEIEPNQKDRIIEALQRTKSVIGYMGDGINDAPALKRADVSISVNTAADVAKDTANIVLLEESLKVLIDGIIEGRKTFMNTMKYIFMATSANFGNMFSMAGASLLLPFLPLLPKQVLLTNLLTDLPEMQIASDTVDPERLQKPHRWDIKFIKKFMIVFGLLSSVFDYMTFGVLYFLVHADAGLFRSAWFTESVISASLIVFVLRTKGVFFKNLPSKNLMLATFFSIVFTLALPYMPFAKDLGFVTIPPYVLAIIFLIVFLYVLLGEITKYLFYKKYDY